MKRESVITLRLDRKLLERVKAVATENRVSVQDIFRTAGEEYANKPSLRSMLENIQASLGELKGVSRQ